MLAEVEILYLKLTESLDHPELYKLVKFVNDAERTRINMSELAEDDFAALIDSVPVNFKDALVELESRYQATLLENPDNHATGIYSPSGIHLYLIWLAKQRTFIVQFLNAYQNRIKRHSELFYNPLHKQELIDAVEHSIEDPLRSLWERIP